MKCKFLLVLIPVVLSLNAKSQQELNYVRTNSYDRINLSIDDFKQIISSIEYYKNATVQDSGDKYDTPTFECDFSNNRKALSLTHIDQLLKLKIKENYTGISLSYRWSNKPLAKVDLDLKNYERTLLVSGRDEKMVDALYNDIDNQLNSKQPILSFINWQFVIACFGSFIFIASTSVLFGSFQAIFSGDKRILTIIVAISTGAIILLFVVYTLSPIKIAEIFPNFLISPDNPSFIDKNLNLISFIGILVTTGMWLFRFVRNLINKKNRLMRPELKNSIDIQGSDNT